MAINRYYSAIAQDTTITSGITSSSTTVVVAGTTGYPTSYPFALALDYGSALEEIVDVTGVAGLTLTITRAVNGTSAVAHAAGATVRHVITARDLTDAQTHYNTALSAGAHGVTGALATFLGSTTSANLASAMTDETGSGLLTFATSPTLTTPILTQGLSTPTFTTNAYTLASSDAGLFLLASNGATAGTINIPTDATYAFANGTQIHIQQTGAGQLTIQATTSGTTTVVSNGATSAAPKVRAQYSVATIMKTASNSWTVYGDIA